MLAMLGVLLMAAAPAHAVDPPKWTLAQVGDSAVLAKSTPGTVSYMVVKKGSPPGTFVLASRTATTRAYQFWAGGRVHLGIVERGGLFMLFDGASRLIPAASFDPHDRDRPTGNKQRLAPAVYGAFVAIYRGLQACIKLKKSFITRPIGRACEDFYKRKFKKVVAKIVGAKLAASLFTCSSTLPKRTPMIIKKIAKAICG